MADDAKLDDPLTSRGERLTELRARAHREWEDWLVETESEGSETQSQEPTAEELAAASK